MSRKKKKEGITIICVNNPPVVGFRALRLMNKNKKYLRRGDIERWKKLLFSICRDILHD